MLTETRNLNCKLDEHRLQIIARTDLVRAHRAVTDREREKAWSAQQAASRLKDAKEAEAKIMATIETGEEVRPVLCRQEKDYLAGVARWIRTDTEEEIEVRTLTESERQQQLQLDEAAAKRGELADEDVPGMPADDVLAEGDGVEAARLEEAPFDDDGNEEDADLDGETPPAPSFVEGAPEGADAFEKNGTARVSPELDAADAFGQAVLGATK